MKTKEMIANIMVYGGVAVILVWLALKFAGIIHSTPLIETLPIYTILFVIGGLVAGVSEFKANVREAFRSVKSDYDEINRKLDDVRNHLSRIEAKLGVRK